MSDIDIHSNVENPSGGPTYTNYDIARTSFLEDTLKPITDHIAYDAQSPILVRNDAYQIERLQNAGQLRIYTRFEITQPLRENIKRIDGVARLIMAAAGEDPSRYSVTVERGKLFTWDEIVPNLVSCLDHEASRLKKNV